MKQVLIVDDSKMTRMTIQNFLPKSLVRVAGQASDGNEAIEMFKRLEPDVVTLDITMPETDGLACIKEMLDFSPRTKIIVITALGDNETAVEAISLGACDFISKPFTEETIVNAINKIVESGSI